MVMRVSAKNMPRRESQGVSSAFRATCLHVWMRRVAVMHARPARQTEHLHQQTLPALTGSAASPMA